MRFMTETKLYSLEDACDSDCENYCECGAPHDCIIHHQDQLIYSYDFQYVLVVGNIYRRIPDYSSRQLVTDLPFDAVPFKLECNK